MDLQTASIVNVSARGTVQENIVPSELATQVSPIRETADSVKYGKAMGWTVELFYGGEFKITNASTSGELSTAKKFITEDLELTIEDFEYLRMTIRGDLDCGQSTTRIETIGSSINQHPLTSDVDYGNDSRFGGDIYFKVNGLTVRIFLTSEKYVISGIRLDSRMEVVDSVYDAKEQVTTVLSSIS